MNDDRLWAVLEIAAVYAAGILIGRVVATLLDDALGVPGDHAGGAPALPDRRSELAQLREYVESMDDDLAGLVTEVHRNGEVAGDALEWAGDLRERLDALSGKVEGVRSLVTSSTGGGHEGRIQALERESSGMGRGQGPDPREDGRTTAETTA